MIVASRAVDVKAGTITYILQDLGYDHEYAGRPCHAVEIDGPNGDTLKYSLRMLGYSHIGCEIRTGMQPPWETRHVQYWAKPEPIPTEGGESP